MPAKKALNILQSIDQCIRLHSARTPKELAEKVGISERQLYKYLNLMKQSGSPIYYCRKRKMYSYKKPGSFVIGFVKE